MFLSSLVCSSIPPLCLPVFTVVKGSAPSSGNGAAPPPVEVYEGGLAPVGGFSFRLSAEPQVRGGGQVNYHGSAAIAQTLAVSPASSRFFFPLVKLVPFEEI